MRKRWTRWAVAFAIIGALVALSPVGEAEARKKVVGRVNGKRFRSNKHSVVGTVNPTILAFGGGVIPHRVGGTVRAIGVVCLVDEFLQQTFPLTLACAADYYELKLGSAAARKQWDTATGVQVTFDRLDGLRIRGSFQGTLEIVDPTHPEDPPATVENGRFDVILMPL